MRYGDAQGWGGWGGMRGGLSLMTIWKLEKLSIFKAHELS